MEATAAPGLLAESQACPQVEAFREVVLLPHLLPSHSCGFRDFSRGEHDRSFVLKEPHLYSDLFSVKIRNLERQIFFLKRFLSIISTGLKACSLGTVSNMLVILPVGAYLFLFSFSFPLCCPLRLT